MIMKKLFLMLLCLSGMATSNAGEMYKTVEISKMKMEVSAYDASEIESAEWAYAFKLRENSSIYGDCCITGVAEGKFYISSPDGSQKYLVDRKGIKPVRDVDYSFEYDGLWAEVGEPLGDEHQVKYLYGYSKDDDVYVVIIGK